jgi:hypothetical protein
MLEKVKVDLEEQFDYAKPSMNFEHLLVVAKRLLKTRKVELGYRSTKQV